MTSTPIGAVADGGELHYAPVDRWTMPTDVSADGRVLLYDDQVIGMKMNAGYLVLDGQPERTDYLATPADERGAKLSPDGEFEIERPQKLFTLPVEWSGFAPAPTGDRFLLLERVGYRSPSLTLVDNWRVQLAL